MGWQRIQGIGRTGAGMKPFPVDGAPARRRAAGPRLEYDVDLFTTGHVTVWAYLSPRNNVLPTDGLKYAVSIDDGGDRRSSTSRRRPAPTTRPMNRQWARNTSDNVNRTATTHAIAGPGVHTAEVLDGRPDRGGAAARAGHGRPTPSYLGPPESHRSERGTSRMTHMNRFRFRYRTPVLVLVAGALLSTAVAVQPALHMTSPARPACPTRPACPARP